VVHRHQPVKFAAIEARWQAEQPAREVLIGIADTSPGQTVTLEVQRGGQRGQARVPVEESPQQVLPRR
jgi:cytochrome bd-type quinol oxidase subunit 1